MENPSETWKTSWTEVELSCERPRWLEFGRQKAGETKAAQNGETIDYRYIFADKYHVFSRVMTCSWVQGNYMRQWEKMFKIVRRNIVQSWIGARLVLVPITQTGRFHYSLGIGRILRRVLPVMRNNYFWWYLTIFLRILIFF